MSVGQGWEEPDENLDALAHLVIGGAIDVHRMIGPGFLEGVYEEALAVELGLRRLPFEREKPIAVFFKGHAVGEGRLDFLVAGRLVVELKAVEALTPLHQAQVLSYLKTTNLPLGLLTNFNVPLLSRGVRRVILSGPNPRATADWDEE
ncbi:MAG: GxxExxY protein [Isosphaeraceae bacterium]|nr:GxxExxY protein [Isosphaeraceae bacterium]